MERIAKLMLTSLVLSATCLLSSCRDNDPDIAKGSNPKILGSDEQSGEPVDGWEWVKTGSGNPTPAPQLAFAGVNTNIVKDQLDQMDELALELYKADSMELRGSAVELSRIVEWAGKSPGYGNYLLCRRSQDLGAIAIARLLVEYGVPSNALKSIADQLASWEPSAEWRATVLDSELNTDIFSKALSKVEARERKQKLWEIWERIKTIADNYTTDDNTVVQEAINNEMKKLEADGILKDSYEMVREAARSDVDFGKIRVTSEQWKRRYLSFIADSTPPDSLRRMKSLISYHELVGGYPLEAPPKKPGAFYGNRTDMERAFISEMAKRKLPLTDYSTASLAADTYEKVKNKSLLDEDTRAMNKKSDNP